MNTYLDCIPCLIRQALEAVRLVIDDPAQHERVLRDVLQWTCSMDMNPSPPVMGQRIHRRIRKVTGIDDPYREIKDVHNRMALGLFPELKAEVTASGNPLIAAVRLAIAGNIIDMGVNGHVPESKIRESITQALTEPFFGERNGFADAVSGVDRILYLTDNAGEIVFDRLLIEELSPERVTVAVRGGPVLNDAVRSDASAAGLADMVEIIDNGSDSPGTLLNDCSPEFIKRFEAADIVIAKGQGNYETLSEVPKKILFLFKAKCPVIAEHARVPLGTHVATRSGAFNGDQR
ncbi:MAG: ARMT1-like domain-containing protein [Desulfobacterales bacterium]